MSTVKALNAQVVSTLPIEARPATTTPTAMTAAAGAVPSRLRRANNGGRSPCRPIARTRSEEHTSELQSLMRISYAVFFLQKKKKKQNRQKYTTRTNSN